MAYTRTRWREGATPPSAANFNNIEDGIEECMAQKVDKASGKGLSSNDYTSAEKTKLAGIAAGAEVNQNAFSKVRVGSTTLEADSKEDTLVISGGNHIVILPVEGSDSMSIATDINNATSSAAGLMSAADKTKLDGINITVSTSSPTSSQGANGDIWFVIE